MNEESAHACVQGPQGRPHSYAALRVTPQGGGNKHRYGLRLSTLQGTASCTPTRINQRAHTHTLLPRTWGTGECRMASDTRRYWWSSSVEKGSVGRSTTMLVQRLLPLRGGAQMLIQSTASSSLCVLRGVQLFLPFLHLSPASTLHLHIHIIHPWAAAEIRARSTAAVGLHFSQSFSDARHHYYYQVVPCCPPYSHVSAELERRPCANKPRPSRSAS